MERVVEAVLVSHTVTSAAGHPVRGTDHPHETVGRVVEVDLDLVGGGQGAGDVVLLSLDGGDEVFVFDRRESGALFGVKVHVRNKKTGVKVSADKGGTSVAVNGELGGLKGPEVRVSVNKVLFLVHDAATFGKSTESHAHTDFVVRKSDEGDRKTVFHEVLVEPESKGHVKATVLAGELDHVVFDGVRVLELTDLFTKTGTGALGEFLPGVHPFGVKSVDFGSSDLDLDFRHKSESDGVHPVGGLVVVSHGVTRSVDHNGGGLDGGKLNFKHKVRHKVTVTAHAGGHLLSESNGSGAEVIELKVLSERSVTTVLGLEKSVVGVSVKVGVLATHGSNLNNTSSTYGHPRGYPTLIKNRECLYASQESIFNHHDHI